MVLKKTKHYEVFVSLENGSVLREFDKRMSEEEFAKLIGKWTLKHTMEFNEPPTGRLPGMIVFFSEQGGKQFSATIEYLPTWEKQAADPIPLVSEKINELISAGVLTRS